MARWDLSLMHAAGPGLRRFFFFFLSFTLVVQPQLFKLVRGMLSVTGPTDTQGDDDSFPLIFLHRSVCCRCAASDYCPGLVPLQCIIQPECHNGIPAGMYACQVWGTEHLREGSEFKIQLQKKAIMLLEVFLGVKSTAANWPVLRECGQEPLQFHWFRATVKFFNSMLDPNSKKLRQVLKADLHLPNMDNSCWSAHVSQAFSGMRNGMCSNKKC
eukprot:1155965-Pelagomonas_calceolata.AAC.4